MLSKIRLIWRTYQFDIDPTVLAQHLSESHSTPGVERTHASSTLLVVLGMALLQVPIPEIKSVLVVDADPDDGLACDHHAVQGQGTVSERVIDVVEENASGEGHCRDREL